jgi:hypothetical protein
MTSSAVAVPILEVPGDFALLSRSEKEVFALVLGLLSRIPRLKNKTQNRANR